MNNIVVNYKISKDINKNVLSAIIDGCASKKYKVFLNIYDFSLSKNAETQIEEYLKESDLSFKITENLKIKIVHKDYEEFSEADNIILGGIIKHGDSLAFVLLPENIALKNIDTIQFEALKEDNIGFIYPDYSINDIRCYLRSRSFNVNISIPAIFWSTSKLVMHLPEKDKLSIVSNKYAGIHVPEDLCTVYTDEK